MLNDDMLCGCMNPNGLKYGTFVSQNLGVDETNGRFGEVSIRRCNFCQRLWLYYFLEYEYLPNSGMWYRGLISEISTNIIPENTLEVIGSLQWYFYGGSYFLGHSGISQGKILI